LVATNTPAHPASLLDQYYISQDCLELVCEIQTNKQTANITWTKDNVPLKLNDRIRMDNVADICCLKIQTPTSADSGNYLCRVEVNGRSEEISHHLRFKDSKAEILDVPKKRKPSVKKTDKEELAEVANSLLTPRKSKPANGVAEKKKLSLKSATSIDEEPQPLMKPSVLGRKPVFSTPLSDRTSTEDTTVKLMCTLLSGIDSEIEWFKNNKPIVGDSKYHISLVEGLAILEINGTIAGDTGEYTCIAKNSCGETSTSAKLKIYGDYHPAPVAPVFTRHIKGRWSMIQMSGRFLLFSGHNFNSRHISSPVFLNSC
jgi:Immunoglobulin I-set domain